MELGSIDDAKLESTELAGAESDGESVGAESDGESVGPD